MGGLVSGNTQWCAPRTVEARMSEYDALLHGTVSPNTSMQQFAL